MARCPRDGRKKIRAQKTTEQFSKDRWALPGFPRTRGRPDTHYRDHIIVWSSNPLGYNFKTMRKMVWLAMLLAFGNCAVRHVVHVIAVDRSTGRVVISSSTCTGTTDDFLKDVQAVVVPGKGVAACQAGVDSATHQNQTLVFDELQRGTDYPSRIIEMLKPGSGISGTPIRHRGFAGGAWRGTFEG